MKLSKRELTIGLGLLVSFFCILVMMFLPIFNGQKPINYLDNLYNSISKGSVYYIPKLKEDAKKYQGKNLEVTVNFLTQQQADDLAKLYKTIVPEVEQSEKTIFLRGDLGVLLAHVLEDADQMFNNKGDQLGTQYGYEARNVMYNWWTTLKAVEKSLNNQKRFEEAKFVMAVQNRAVECSFNYSGIVPRDISTAVIWVIGSLAFYVVYTLWFGFAIMYIFIGMGLKLEH